MNIFQQLKEKKVLDKDGKVDALGPYGKQKLTGSEVAQYFRKNKVRDAKVKKAVEVALDLGGAMSVAQKEIKKFYGSKILNSREVKNALKFANESYEINNAAADLEEGFFAEETAFEAMQDIVKNKQAKKVKGVMVDMFTASVITQAYDKVNDSNKKKIEKAKLEQLVKMAHKVMGMKTKMEGLDEAVNYHTKVSGMRIIHHMKNNKVLKKYAKQIPTRALTTYDLAQILNRQMNKFAFNKKEVKAIEDVMQAAYSDKMKKENIDEGKMGQVFADIQQGATAKELAKDYKIPLDVAKDFLKDYYMQKRDNRKAYA